ncbi:MAG TPA: hypothetical protein DCD96_07320, partial [Flavobacteriales bacterium]|nr:hypothetical protein [Flavobacteriales bacterium]
MTKLIIVLIILLGIIAIAQLMRVLELSAQLRNKREEDISAGDTKLNANLMILFIVSLYVSFIYLLAKYGNGGLPVAASAQGAETDWLLNINFYLIIVVFFITNTLLFVFASKYAYNKERKAFFYPHNNKLELLWTVVPAAVLAVIIILGLKTWNNITTFDDSEGERVKIELYSKQFEWIARYSGEDNLLGRSDFRLVTGENPLGVQTTASIDATIAGMEKMIVDLDSLYAKSGRPSNPSEVMTEAARAKTKAKKERMQRHLKKVIALRSTMSPEIDQQAADDRVIKLKEIHLVVNKDYEFLFRSQDVIHSAYMPHFRSQMNTVPGMVTRLKLRPTIDR